MESILKSLKNNHRKIRIWEMLLSKRMNNIPTFNDDMDTNQRIERISNSISTICNTSNVNRDDVINELDNVSTRNLLSNSEIEWIEENNARQCFFLWSYLIF